MPWTIVKQNDKFCVTKEDTGETVPGGCHSDRAQAEIMMKALYASESKKSTVNYNVDTIEDAIYNIKLAIALQNRVLQGEITLSEDAQEELNVYLEETLAALNQDNEEDSEEDLDETLLASTDGMQEYAWQGPIVFENVLTGDKRIFKNNSIHWEPDTLPWALRWQKSSGQGHAGSVPVGRVDSLQRMEDGSIVGRGVVIPALSEEATEYLKLLKTGVGGGVSVDGDSAEFDIIETDDGQPRVEFSSMRLRALSAVDIPAFNGARIHLVDETPAPQAPMGFQEDEAVTESVDEVTDFEIISGETEEVELETIGADSELHFEIEDEAPEEILDGEIEELAKKKKKKKKMSYGWKFDNLIASAIPVIPTVEAFVDPEFDGPTPLTVTSDGKVFGHLALFNTCHIGFPGTCVKPPKGSKYQYFHTGQIETSEGHLVDVGHLTFNTGHAGMNDGPKAAAQHYDNTGTVAADVRAGEDEFGIWVVGALRSHLSDEDIRAFRSAPLSGDWRRIAGKLELVGALAVNIPGFPVPRVKALVASGETETLFTFLEDDDEEFISEYELQLRFDKKDSIAQKFDLTVEFATETLDDLLSEPDDKTYKDLSDQAILNTDLPELPKNPTKKTIQDQTDGYNKSRLLHDLQTVRDLLDDPNEKMTATMRKNLELLYGMFITSDKQSGKKVTAAGEDIEEFFNHCHGKGGKFCPTSGKAGGPGGGRNRQRGGNQRQQGQRQQGQHGNQGKQQHGGNQGVNAHSLNARDRANAVTQLENYQRAKQSAKRWSITAIVASAASSAASHGILPLVSAVSPLLANPVVLATIGIGSVFAAGNALNNARNHRREFTTSISKVNKRQKIEQVIQHQKAKQIRI